jgi:hypothetical protein
VTLLLALVTALLVFAPLVLAGRRLVQVTKALDYHPDPFVGRRHADAARIFRDAATDERLADDALRELGSALFAGDPATREARVNEALAELDGRIGVGVGIDVGLTQNRGVGALVRLFVYGGLLEAALAYAAGVTLRDGACLLATILWSAYLWAYLERLAARRAAELREGLDRWVDRGLAMQVSAAPGERADASAQPKIVEGAGPESRHGRPSIARAARRRRSSRQ